MKRAIDRTRQKARGARGAAFVLAVGSCTMVLASCVAPPQTMSEANDRTGAFGKARYPKCSAFYQDIEATSFVKPAVDVGNGMVVAIDESHAHGTSNRYAEVLDCETGLSLNYREPLVGAGDAAGRVQTFSDDRAFKSPLETFLHGLAASGRNDSLRSISRFAKSEGISAEPSMEWAPDKGSDSAFGNPQACACDLYYPGTPRYWFDSERVGPGYPEALGSYPRTLRELEARMSALRALK
ncbi:hypothetical protein [Gemmobacter serpentinus]|uniref:hypothetical protein n=1 Tax=Gemmobacter serpentinus TaxID=2652247 RepID=UPI00124BFFAD|nr:hypothetical protein [Gemmobacter serpentinus]